jgi:lipid-A-disaccharide synthase
LSACDYSIVTSGTATLEGALCKTPMIVIYKTNLISYFILSKLIQTKFISLPNILSEKKIVNELIQTDVNKINLIIELDKLMNEDNNQMALDFVSLHNSLINRDKSKFFDVLNSI